MTTSLTNDIIIVYVFNEKSGSYQSVSSITDTAGLSWSKRTTLQLSSDTGSNLDVWWAPSTGALSSDVITANLSGSIDDACIIAFGVNGANFTSPWDPNSGLPDSDSGSSSNGSVSVSTTDNDCMLLGFWGSPSGGAVSAGSGYTQIQQANNVGGARFAYSLAEYKTVSSAQSSTSITTSHASEAWGMVGDAITSNAGAPSGTWASTEATDTFAGAGYPQLKGTMASTEAKDVMDFMEGPHGGWASTDAKDVMDFHGGLIGEMSLDGYAAGGAQSSGSGVGSASATLSTNLDDDVIVLCVSNGGYWQYSPVASVSDTAGLTWHRRASHPASGGQQEIWWAHAPTPLSADAITVDVSTNPALAGGASPSAGKTGAISIVAFAVNGANYSAPWDTHILSHQWTNNQPYGQPLTGQISTAASNTFCFGFYANNNNLVPAPSAPFTYLIDAQENEHNGFTMTAAVEYDNVTAIQDGVKVGFGSGGTLMTDVLVQSGLAGTVNEILWYFDGVSYNVGGTPVWPGGEVAFTGPDTPVFSMSMTTNYENEMIVLACLISSASGAGTVASVSDTVGLSPGWARRSRSVSSDGQLALEVWWAWTHRALNSSDGITITPANVANGDSMTVLGFGIVGAAGFYDNVWWDGGELPLSATGRSAESAVTGFSTLNLDTLNFAIMGNLDSASEFTLPPGSNAVAPYAVGPQITNVGPISNLALIYNYSGPVTITDGVIEDTVIPPVWVAVGDAIPVGPPLPPTGAWNSTEATDKCNNDSAFGALGWATGWAGFVPALCTWASIDVEDTCTNDGAFTALPDGERDGWPLYQRSARGPRPISETPQAAADGLFRRKQQRASGRHMKQSTALPAATTPATAACTAR